MAFTGVIVQEVVKFSDEFCTPASFQLPKAHAANYTGALSTNQHVPHAITDTLMLYDNNACSRLSLCVAVYWQHLTFRKHDVQDLA